MLFLGFFPDIENMLNVVFDMSLFIQRIELLLDTNKKSHGIKIKSFYDKTGIKTSTFNNWKVKGTCPSIDKILIIAHYFNVSIDWLITGESPASDTETSTETMLLSRRIEALESRDRELIVSMLESMEKSKEPKGEGLLGS